MDFQNYVLVQPQEETPLHHSKYAVVLTWTLPEVVRCFAHHPVYHEDSYRERITEKRHQAAAGWLRRVVCLKDQYLYFSIPVRNP